MQIVIHKYYVEVDNPEWACDSIVMEELDPFSSIFLSEEITRIDSCEEFPKANIKRIPGGRYESVNAASYKFNKQTNTWDSTARWDLDETF